MRKTIGINTLFLVPNDVGGTEYHTRSFVKHLEKLDKENYYIVFCNKENYSTFKFKSRNWKKVLCPISAKNRLARLIYEQTVLPVEIDKRNCSIVHSFGYIGPLCAKAKKIITVYDVNWRDQRQDFFFLERAALQFLAETSMRSADAIVVPSKFSQLRLLSHFPAYKNKVSLISGGLDDEFKVLLKKSKESNNSIIKKPYVLCVSSMYPHKRIPYLLDIWKEIIKLDPELQLIIIGQNGKDEKKVLQRIKNLPRIYHHRKVSFLELVLLYKNAEGFILPSIYEGFGHPIYEALYAKTPCFVGDKVFYTKEMQRVLHKLSRDTVEDAKMILKFKKKRGNTIKLSSYKKGTSKLIDLYNNIQKYSKKPLQNC